MVSRCIACLLGPLPLDRDKEKTEGDTEEKNGNENEKLDDTDTLGTQPFASKLSFEQMENHLLLT